MTKMARRRVANNDTATDVSRVKDILCKNCKVKINNRKDTSVKCAQCGGWIHLRCSTLKAVDLKAPEKVNGVKCRRCKFQRLETDEDGSNEGDEDDEMAVDVAGTTPTISSDKRHDSFIKQILCQMKNMGQALLRLEEENSEIKAAMKDLVSTNSRLLKHVDLLSKRLEDKSKSADQKEPAVYNNERGRPRSRTRPTAGRHPEAGRDLSSSRVRLPIHPRPLQQLWPKSTNRVTNKTLIKKVCHSADVGSSQTQPPPYRLPVVKTRINTRRLHVANLCSSVSAENIYNHLVNQAGVHAISVKKLRSRGSSSGRFYVEVLDVDYNDVIKDDLWESDTELAFYRGPLRADLVIESFPKA